MSTSEERKPGSRGAWMAPLLLAASYAIGHALLYFGNEATRSLAFLMGDRSQGRLKTLLEISDAMKEVPGSMLFLAYGNPGDFVLHLLPWLWGGIAGVVTAPVLVGLLGVLARYGFARRCFDSIGLAFMAALVYAIFPGRLLHPHVLATEAFFTPLLVGHVALLVHALTGGRNSNPALLGAGVLAGLAALLRPAFVLFPLIEVALLLGFRSTSWRRMALCAVPALVLGFAIPLGSVTMGGPFGWGVSAHSLEANLHDRAIRIAQYSGATLELPPGRRNVLRPGGFAAFAVRHPLGTLRTIAADAPTWTMNLGVNAFLGRYLELYELPRSRSHLARRSDETGPLDAIFETARNWPGAFWWNVPPTIGWVLLVIAAAAGALRVRRQGLMEIGLWFCLVTLPVYMIASSHAANVLRWNHRSTIEFIVVLFGFWVVAAARHGEPGMQSNQD